MAYVRHPLTEEVSHMDFSNFTVTTNISVYDDIEEMSLRNLQAKHIMVRDADTEKIYNEALQGGHTHIIWGTTRGGTPDIEWTTIQKMISDDFQKSIRITITDRHVWSDNNHTTISYILRNKNKISEVPHYIVDCRGLIPIIVGKEQNIIWDPKALKDVARRAYRLQLMEEHEGRKTSW